MESLLYPGEGVNPNVVECGEGWRGGEVGGRGREARLVELCPWEASYAYWKSCKSAEQLKHSQEDTK